MAARMSVLVISHQFPKYKDDLSGNFVLRQLQAVGETGIRLQVVSPVPYIPSFVADTPGRRATKALPNNARVDGIDVSYPRYARLPGRRFVSQGCIAFRWAVAPIVKRLAKGYRVDLIHAYTATPDGFAATALGARLGVPVVCTLLGSDVNTYPGYSKAVLHLTRRVLRNVDRSIAVSSALRSRAQELAGTSIPCDVAYMGCNTSLFRFDAEARLRVRRRLGLGERQRIILYLGRVVAAKGVLDLLKAFRFVTRETENAHLVYVGTGEERSLLDEAVSKGDLGHRVHFAGRVNDCDVPGWLSAADIFTLPSHVEGLPLAVLEAMSCARPVVATGVGGVPEAVTNNESGLLVDPGDIAGLGDALLQLLEAPAVAEEMGRVGRQIVENRFTWEQSASRLLEIYEDVLG